MTPRAGAERFQPEQWNLMPADWADNVKNKHELVTGGEFQFDRVDKMVKYGDEYEEVHFEEAAAPPLMLEDSPARRMDSDSDDNEEAAAPPPLMLEDSPARRMDSDSDDEV